MVACLVLGLDELISAKFEGAIGRQRLGVSEGQILHHDRAGDARAWPLHALDPQRRAAALGLKTDSPAFGLK
jgi:hypothetical protein